MLWLASIGWYESIQENFFWRVFQLTDSLFSCVKSALQPTSIKFFISVFVIFYFLKSSPSNVLNYFLNFLSLKIFSSLSFMKKLFSQIVTSFWMPTNLLVIKIKTYMVIIYFIKICQSSGGKKHDPDCVYRLQHLKICS